MADGIEELLIIFTLVITALSLWPFKVSPFLGVLHWSIHS